jgi:hypothetical protein
MAYVRCVFVGGLFAAILMLGGCLSAENSKRIDDLVSENEKLATKQREIIIRAQQGLATPEEIAFALKDIVAQMEKNAKEIKDIRDSSGTWAVIGGVAATLGRSLLHGAAAAIPATNPIGLGIHAVLMFLLGGSQTVKKTGATPAT